MHYYQPKKIYFQKQGMLSNRCALHAVNNLLGACFFSQDTFDQICDVLEKQSRSLGLDIKNRHYIGGDYDANVIIKAVENCGLQIRWIDSRKIYEFKSEPGNSLIGFIVNIKQKESSIKKFFNLSDRHWICIKMHELIWYILDSKKQQEKQIIDIDLQINRFLREGSEVLQVRQCLYIEEMQNIQEKIDKKNEQTTNLCKQQPIKKEEVNNIEKAQEIIKEVQKTQSPNEKEKDQQKIDNAITNPTNQQPEKDKKLTDHQTNEIVQNVDKAQQNQ